MKKESLASVLQEFITDQLKQMIISNPKEKAKVQKIKIRPVKLKDEIYFQAEEFTKTQAFHKNLTLTEVISYIEEQLVKHFKQGTLEASNGQAHILVSKNNTTTIKVKRSNCDKNDTAEVFNHNRKKQYLLQEGIYVPFLEDLGVMTKDGKIIRSRYDKFRQINRFLEMVEDIIPALDKNKMTRIIDFGCGKSYLTFALYHYLHVIRGYDVSIVGLDLKQEVIAHCQNLTVKYGYKQLTFLCGDIASYEGADEVDMVVSLHACNTATDYALYKGILWNAKVILSVPCCQHEVNKQIHNELLKPIMNYGILKERLSALYTDGLRAELLESVGYRTQILEFVDMEHTPKNILIRSVFDGKKKDNKKEIQDILDFFEITPTLYRLLRDEE